MKKSVNVIVDLDYSARDLSLKKLKKICLMWLAVCFIMGVFDQNIILNLIMLLGNIVILVNQIFKVFLTINNGNHEYLKQQQISIPAEELPLYTILVPLYKEAAVAKQLVENLSSLNYPKERLQILLVCEEDDVFTIQAFKEINLPAYFNILIVPHSFPKTKPKACNYALKYAQGEYITIYDADDQPDVNQLIDVVNNFRILPPEYICIQAKLNYYNRKENILTKLFAIEYYHWFEIMLPNLYKYGMIIPLGGTSNHFKTKELCKIGGWDSYNVTEDAELGFRIGIKNYKTYLIDSITLEEAPLTLKSWSIQRSRWIKGYLQTYLLYLKNIRVKADFSIKQNIGFHFFVGLPMLSFMLLPALAFIMAWSLKFGGSLLINFEIIKLCKVLGMINLGLMIFLPMIIAILVFKKSKWQAEIFSIINYPFYWFLHTISSYRAIYHLFKMTYYWDKTEHGLTRIKHNLYKENQKNKDNNEY